MSQINIPKSRRGRVPGWQRIEAAVLAGRIPCGEPITSTEILERAGLALGSRGGLDSMLSDLSLNRSPVRLRAVPGEPAYIAESTAPVATLPAEN